MRCLATSRGKQRGLVAHGGRLDLGTGSNYSSVNMAFQGAVLALRYIPDEAIKANLRIALQGPPADVLSDPDMLIELGLEPLPVTTVARELANRGYVPPEGILEGKELLAWLRG